MAAVTTTINAALLDVGQDVESDARSLLARSRAIGKRELRRRRLVLALLAVADVAASVVLLLASYSFKFTGLPPYALDKSLVDSLCLTFARVIALSTQTAAGWWLGFAATTLAACKAIVYGHAAAPLCGSAVVLVAVVAAAAELVASGRCAAAAKRLGAVAALKADGDGDAAALEAKVADLLKPKPVVASFRGYWRVLRAYFIPTGTLNKIRTLTTFAIMGGSKACNLLAPLYIGEAAQALAGGRVPYAEVGVYCALRFGSSALSELQRLVYIRVKQHAFAEIAEGTFRHLLALSLDWHLKKKMGEVLRVMDRGISSADSVMNYLVLYLLPSVAEFGVTIVLFFVRFASPELSAAALLSFVIYCVLTVTITAWRKKFRQGQNKSDNKYHEIATDSLVNFETVKCYANEDLEVGRFRDAVRRYQSYNVGVQASLSLLNSSQQLDIQLTTLASLCIAASSILLRSRQTGDPIQIGDFVSVNAYVLQLFTPLSFLGTIYSAVTLEGRTNARVAPSRPSPPITRPPTSPYR